jgi:hypothetical protein
MRRSAPVLLSIGIIAMLIIAGCVAPPKESPTTVSGAVPGAANVVPGVTTATPAHVYVTEVTPYGTTAAEATPTSGYSTFAAPTPLPEDRSCRIYTTTQTFLYNGTAFSFDLKTPPMYINYSVIPTNVTEAKAYTSRYLSKTDGVVTYSTYDPQCYLEITVRNKNTGEIYLQDGFGKDYSTYLDRNLKVLNAGDMIVEIKGNKISGTINVWVKPYGNFDNYGNMTFDTCTFFTTSPRDSTAYAWVTSTPTPTWTYS